MFKTSQPNPERSNDQSPVENRGAEPQFETLVDFSKWLNEQLAELESQHEEFLTSDSMRSFFKR
ncbi:MAG: hypothetical protein ACI814_001827 [Mariniblastus sp.]|jgi:hypothetical protein